MIKITTNIKYYMFISSSQKSYKFENFEKLINYVSKENYLCSQYNKICNNYLENINLNFNDMKINYCFLNHGIAVKREYLFYDSNNRIIDLRLYSNLILKEVLNYPFICNNYKKNKKKEQYIFRKTPIPYIGIHYYRSSRNNNHRSIYIQELRKSELVEKKYLKKERIKSLKSIQDDYYRSISSRSWKSQSKKKKQWINNS